MEIIVTRKEKVRNLGRWLTATGVEGRLRQKPIHKIYRVGGAGQNRRPNRCHEPHVREAFPKERINTSLAVETGN